MKKYVISFMSVDMLSCDNEGVLSGTNFGILPDTFDSREEAEIYLMEEIIPEDKRNLTECLDVDEDEEESSIKFEIEEAYYGRVALNVYDRSWELINSTTYDISEIEV